MTGVVDEGAAADSFSVSIVLVPKDEAAHSRKRLRRTQAQADSETGDTDNDKTVVVESRTLRKYSRYFATCMSGRWETDNVFHLELLTEPHYYHDCFARMNRPLLKPIPTVTYGIQLFKVASQIEYLALMDICEKYLAAAPWSMDEESELRSTCALSELPSHSDLVVRLHFPSTKKARGDLQSMIQRTLSRYLKNALDVDPKKPELQAPLVVFAEAFHELCEESSTNEMGEEALLYALAVVEEEMRKILLDSISTVGRGWANPYPKVEGGMLRFCWMFQVMREANAAQILVELLLKHDDVSKVLLSTIEQLDAAIRARASPDAGHEWAKMIYCIIQDILGGYLFLNSAERMALFFRHSWALGMIDYLAPGEPPVSEVVASFISSFPQLEQEELHLMWDQVKDYYNFPDAPTMSIKSMLRSNRDVADLGNTAAAPAVDANHGVELPRITGQIVPVS